MSRLYCPKARLLSHPVSRVRSPRGLSHRHTAANPDTRAGKLALFLLTKNVRAREGTACVLAPLERVSHVSSSLFFRGGSVLKGPLSCLVLTPTPPVFRIPPTAHPVRSVFTETFDSSGRPSPHLALWARPVPSVGTQWQGLPHT